MLHSFYIAAGPKPRKIVMIDVRGKKKHPHFQLKLPGWFAGRKHSNLSKALRHHYQTLKRLQLLIAPKISIFIRIIQLKIYIQFFLNRYLEDSLREGLIWMTEKCYIQTALAISQWSGH
jgi:hypothetical protein